MPETTTKIPRRIPAPLVDRLLYCQRHLRTRYVYLVMPLDGCVDTQRLARAVRLVVDAEPVLGCRFVPSKIRPFWERREDLDQVDLLLVEESADVGGVLRKFMSYDRDPCRDTQLRLLLIRADVDTLCLELNRMCSDGKGIVDLVYLLASTYRRLKEEPDLRLPANLADRSYRALGKHLKLRGKLKIIGNARHTARKIRKAAKWELPPVDADPNKPDFEVRTFSEDRVRAIRDYARSNRAPFSLVLMTAFLRAVRNLVPHTKDLPVSFVVHVDMRNFLPPTQVMAICQLSGGTLLLGSPEHHPRFEDDLAHFREQLKGKNRPYGGVVSPSLILETLQPISGIVSVLPFSLLQWLHRRSVEAAKRGKLNAVGMSFGQIDSEKMRLGEVGVTGAYVIGSIPKVSGILHFGAMRLGDTLSFSTSWMGSQSFRKFVLSIFDQIELELPR